MIDPDAQYFRHPSDESFEAGFNAGRQEGDVDAFFGGVLVGAFVGVFGCLAWWVLA